MIDIVLNPFALAWVAVLSTAWVIAGFYLFMREVVLP